MLLISFLTRVRLDWFLKLTWNLLLSFIWSLFCISIWFGFLLFCPNQNLWIILLLQLQQRLYRIAQSRHRRFGSCLVSQFDIGTLTLKHIWRSNYRIWIIVILIMRQSFLQHLLLLSENLAIRTWLLFQLCLCVITLVSPSDWLTFLFVQSSTVLQSLVRIIVLNFSSHLQVSWNVRNACLICDVNLFYLLLNLISISLWAYGGWLL